MSIPPGVEVRRDVTYGTGGGRELKLDLFLPPEGEGVRPGVVFIHGGAWRAGGRGQFARQSAHLAAQGYVCACIEYRLSGEAQFPAALEDSKCALRWMRAHADELKLDPERVAVSGGSAGGHLAAMVATTDDGAFEGTGGDADQSSRANLAVCFNPALDFTGLGEQGKALPPLEAFLGATFADDPELYTRASPITYVDENDPPFLMLHGTADTTIPHAQSEAFLARLEEVGVEGELFSAEGARHAFFNGAPWYDPTVEAMQKFLDRHFRADGQ